MQRQPWRLWNLVWDFSTFRCWKGNVQSLTHSNSLARCWCRVTGYTRCFRPVGKMVHMTLADRLIQEKWREQSHDLYIAFIVVTKVFGTVNFSYGRFCECFPTFGDIMTCPPVCCTVFQSRNYSGEGWSQSGLCTGPWIVHFFLVSVTLHSKRSIQLKES